MSGADEVRHLEAGGDASDPWTGRLVEGRPPFGIHRKKAMKCKHTSLHARSYSRTAHSMDIVNPQRRLQLGAMPPASLCEHRCRCDAHRRCSSPLTPTNNGDRYLSLACSIGAASIICARAILKGLANRATPRVSFELPCATRRI